MREKIIPLNLITSPGPREERDAIIIENELSHGNKMPHENSRREKTHFSI